MNENSDLMLFDFAKLSDQTRFISQDEHLNISFCKNKGLNSEEDIERQLKSEFKGSFSDDLIISRNKLSECDDLVKTNGNILDLIRNISNESDHGKQKEQYKLLNEESSKWIEVAKQKEIPDNIAENTKLRSLACFCCKKNWISVTLRTDVNNFVKEQTDYLYDSHILPNQNDVVPNTFIKEWITPENPEYLFSNELISNEISKILFSNNEKIGLVIICASTKSGKNCVTQEIIRKVLYDKLKNESRYVDADRKKYHLKRRPHLVTMEDPIESPILSKFFDNPNYLRLIQMYYGIDYTPRVRNIDVPSIKAAISDLLRQTPTVFYVSEIRNNKEWSPLVNFAGTGHLVITTAHASSITEMFKKLFKENDVQTPVDRSNIIGKILAVIHLKSSNIVIDGCNYNYTIPSIWKNTNSSKNEMVSDGIASVLPHSSGVEYSGCLGHKYFAKKFFEYFKEIYVEKKLNLKIKQLKKEIRQLKKDKTQYEKIGMKEKDLKYCEAFVRNIDNIRHSLFERAIEWDLEEL